MIIQNQFEIRQMELYGSNENDVKKILEYHTIDAFKQIAVILEGSIKFKPIPNTMHRYAVKMLVVELDQYAIIRNKIRDILKQSLDAETYKQVGELFKQLED